jgi:subtilisin family serine protease
MCQEVIEYFKANGVRVVNMSWTVTLRSRESNLEVNAIGKDAEDRAKLAREMFDIEKDALFYAMKNAPEILFVTSAGNENDDVAFEDHYPNSFDLSNLLVVGAVDQSGDETSFTSFGATVDVYANGFEVESYIPGGEKLPGSGTSASSPNAANLAAKLFALQPSLTPSEVIALIKDGAEPNAEGLLLINPKKSAELLKGQKKSQP